MNGNEKEQNDELLYPNATSSIVTQRMFENHCNNEKDNGKTIKEKFYQIRKNVICSRNCFKNFFLTVFPFINIMRQYKIKEDMFGDIISGLTVGVMQLSQGMAYAFLATLSPVYGLYSSLFPSVCYFFFGTSRHISFGTASIVSLMVGSTIEKNYKSMMYFKHENHTNDFAVNDTDFTTISVNKSISKTEETESNNNLEEEIIKARVLVAISVTLFVGIFQLIMGILRLGFLTMYLSQPLTRGFTTGAAVHVFTSQVPQVFGIKIQRFSGPLKLIYTYIDIFKNIKSIIWAAFIIAVLSLIILYLTKTYLNPLVKKKIKIPIPIDLIVIIIATVSSYYGQFEKKYNLKIVGDIPTGIPVPQIPPSLLFVQLAVDSFVICIVSYSVSISMAKTFAKKHDYEIDSNQELIAHGIMNSVCSMFNCFVGTIALSRSSVQESAGGKTQISSLISSSVILFALLFVAKLFQQLPYVILASIVIVALKGMFLQITDLKKLWYISKYDFFIWLVTCLATIIIDVEIGLATGIVFSLLTVIVRTKNSFIHTLGEIPNTEIYKNVNVLEEAQEINGIKILQFDGSLYYANCENFVSKLSSIVNLNPRHFKVQKQKHEKHIADKKINFNNNNDPKVESACESEVLQLRDDLSQYHTIIIDCSLIGFIDSAGVSALTQIFLEYNDINIDVFLANCKSSIAEILKVSGFFDHEHIFTSIHEGVLFSLRKTIKI